MSNVFVNSFTHPEVNLGLIVFLSLSPSSYPCEWGGIVDGKPCVKGLERFGKAVLEDLWGAVLKQFVEVRSCI